MLKIDYTAAEARAEVIADTLGIRPVTNLNGRDGAPSAELMRWCRKYGVSLDYVFAGDIRPLIRRAAELAKRG